jgi:hypothetical protein
MDEIEFMEFLFLFVSLGVILNVYYPGIWVNLLWVFALVGAVYLIWGILSRLMSAFPGVRVGRKNDWWTGAGILTMVVIFFAAPGYAVAALGWVVMVILGIGALLIKAVSSILV